MTAAARAAPRTVHVVVGPQEHGVVRHAVAVARALGHPVVRLDLPTPVALPADTEVVHLPYTDRLYAPRIEDSITAFEALVAPWRAAGVGLSVTLHDLPARGSDLERRRALAYARVVELADGVVVSSWRELDLLEAVVGPGERAVALRSRRCIPLPLEAASVTSTPTREPGGTKRSEVRPEVVVLGFLFPDRGYEHTIDELPAGVDLVALGGPSDGHEDLPEVLAARAAKAGHALTTTGFVPDAELGEALLSAAVPVAPNRRVAASASVNTWVAHGRRPLVPDSPYARELVARGPGRVTLYDADRPGALRTAISEALAHPERTWVEPGVWRGPSLDDVAADYAGHLAACAPPAALPVAPGRWVVPGNRWDLLTHEHPTPPPTVSVVVPYYEAQAQLDLVLTALSHQRYPLTRLQVVVADDGSHRPPSVPPDLGALRVKVVRQDDRGFRAAAARNLGAAATDGDVLAFLDGDTVPEPDYVRRLTRLVALAPDTLTVGRRRHADLSGWAPERLTRWLLGQAPGPRELPEPGWLAEGYAASRELLDVDPRSYRYVISAVMALSRDLFAELGGFDESFTSYGGEDWELAHRAYVAGAVLAHVPRAVAWHDGPDWAGRATTAEEREAARSAKEAETRALARLVPDTVARGGGRWDRPATVVVLEFVGAAEVLATVRSAVAGDADCGVWLEHPDAARTVARLDEPWIAVGPPPTDVLRRALTVVRLQAPAPLGDLTELARLSERHGTVGLPTGWATSARAASRARRTAAALGEPVDVVAARLFGGLDLPSPQPLPQPLTR